MDINGLIAKNAKRWEVAKVTHSIDTINTTAKRLVAAKDRYLTTQAATNVPWFIVAVIHEREASQSWLANLAQGDPWNKKSRHVPRNRGPFPDWESAAEDALKNCPPKAASWTDWSPGGALTLLEEYNGLGYARMGRPSPYVWACTQLYVSGKYVRDGHYDPSAIDHQLGCAALLKQMMILDNSIKFGATP